MHIWIMDYKYQRVQWIWCTFHDFSFLIQKHQMPSIFHIWDMIFDSPFSSTQGLRYKYYRHVISFFVFLFSTFCVSVHQMPFPVRHAIWDLDCVSCSLSFFLFFKFSSAHLMQYLLRTAHWLRFSVKRVLTRAFNTVHHHKSRYSSLNPSMWRNLCSSDSICDTSFKFWKTKKKQKLKRKTTTTLVISNESEEQLSHMFDSIKSSLVYMF